MSCHGTPESLGGDVRLRARTRWRPVVLAVLAALASLSLGPLPAPSADRAPRIHVYFSPHGGAEQAVVRALGGARHQVLAAIYDLTDPAIAEALVDAAARGVETRVIMDAHEAQTRRSQYRRLAQALGARVALRSGVGNPYAIMHDKFAVIDGGRVLTGSFNWTRLAECCNHENLLVIDDADLARLFAREFERIWSER